MALGLLLEGAVQVADLGVAVDNRLAVQFQRHVNDAVHRRVARAHVHEHVACFRPGVLLLVHVERRVLGVVVERLFLILRVILAQRMALEAVVQQDAAQVRVAVEGDAEHVVHLALEPVGPLPHRHERVDARVVVRHRRLQPHPLVVRQRVQVRHHLVARLAALGEVIHRGQVHQHVVVQVRLVAQEARRVAPRLAAHRQRIVAVLGMPVQHRLGKRLLQPGAGNGLFNYHIFPETVKN